MIIFVKIRTLNAYKKNCAYVFSLFFNYYCYNILGADSAHPPASPSYRNQLPYCMVLRGGTSFGRCAARSIAGQTIDIVIYIHNRHRLIYNRIILCGVANIVFHSNKYSPIILLLPI